MDVGAVSKANEATLIVLLVISLGIALGARRLRFPYTLALVIAGLALGLLNLLPNIRLAPETVLLIFLPTLLFEGAWNLDTRTLRANWLVIFLLAVPGLLISQAIITAITHWGAGLPLLLALLVGAIVSPTDPVAVIALLGHLGMPARLRVLIEGESLFNDGVGTVAFQIILGLLVVSLGGASDVIGGAPWLTALRLLWLVLGGPILGVAIGYIVSRLVRVIDDHLFETAVTFCVAYGAYLIAEELLTSGLLAVVCAGLVLGSYGRKSGMSARTAETVDGVWEFVAFVANSLLFLLLGASIGASSLQDALIPLGWAVLAVLLGRAVMVYLLLPLYNRLCARRASGGKPAHEPVPRRWRPLILLSGLRGALSIALALSLPTTIPQRTLLLSIVYGVVLVTLLGQGITMRFLLPRLPKM